MTPRFERVAMVGVGLIGGCLAIDLRREGVAAHLAGTDADPENLDRARALAIVDEIGPLSRVVDGADLVVVAVHPAQVAPVVLEVAAHAPRAIITDVGSVKKAVLAGLEGRLPSGVRFVGGHPIAGTERSGAAAAFPELFRGRRCILTPTAATDPGALSAVRAMWEAVGAEVVLMDPEHHDRVCAAISHLPHVAAYALTAAVAELAGEHPEIYGLGAGGFSDTTRIASSNPQMWRDIFLLNRDAVLDVIDALRGQLDALRSLVAEADAPGMEELFARTREVRARTLRDE